MRRPIPSYSLPRWLVPPSGKVSGTSSERKSKSLKPGTGMPNKNIMSVRAKFTCGSAQPIFGFAKEGDTSPSKQVAVNLSFYPVYESDGPNKLWSEATPSGALTMYVTNPAVFDAFKPGQSYYLDISPVS